MLDFGGKDGLNTPLSDLVKVHHILDFCVTESAVYGQRVSMTEASDHKYDLVVLPVTNGINQLIGRITIDDVVDLIVEEAEKDYQMLSGISEDIESSYNVWQITRARFPWLLIGMIGGEEILGD